VRWCPACRSSREFRDLRQVVLATVLLVFRALGRRALYREPLINTHPRRADEYARRSPDIAGQLEQDGRVAHARLTWSAGVNCAPFARGPTGGSELRNPTATKQRRSLPPECNFRASLPGCVIRCGPHTEIEDRVTGWHPLPT